MAKLLTKLYERLREIYLQITSFRHRNKPGSAFLRFIRNRTFSIPGRGNFA